MKWPLALLALFLASGATLLSSELAEEKADWLTDWATAQRAARQTNKPILAILVCKH